MRNDRSIINLSFYRLVIFIMALLVSAPVYPHGGGLNRQGCHNVTATGGYHCHRGGSSSTSKSGSPSLTLSLLLATSVLVAAIAINIKNAETKRGQKSNNLLYSKPHPKFIITPYLDNNKYGIQWEASIHP